jgi:flagellar biosynthetic protein FliP
MLVFFLSGTSDVAAQPSNRPTGKPAAKTRKAEVQPVKDELVPPAPEPERAPPLPLGVNIDGMTSPQGLSASLKVMLLLTVLSLAPAILMMTTCFIRFVVVMSLLRQALGTQQLPPNQVIISLCLFLTFMVMAPVWNKAYEEGVRPYTNPAPGDEPIDEMTALARTLAPLREFMSDQIERADNSDAVWMFLDFQQGTQSAGEEREEPQSYADVPLSVLLPAYMLSELKVSFLIGFQIYLPFVVIDMVISTLLISMGMMMLPPVLVSLPFKLLLFVLIDGWTLTVGMLLASVRPTG